MTDVLLPHPTQTIRFHPSGRTAPADNGVSLFEIARRSRVHIEGTCDGVGTCGKCQVTVGGDASPITHAERHFLTPDLLDEGIRLACQVHPHGSVEVEVPEAGPLNILSEGLSLHIPIHPHIRKEYVELPPPNLGDQADDISRISAKLGRRVRISPDIDLLQRLPAACRSNDWKITIIRAGSALIGVEPGDTTANLFGIAFDIGTTTVVAYLRNLNTGESLGVAAAMNPQTTFGGDVIARINHTMLVQHGRGDLRKAIVHCIHKLVSEVCENAKVSPTLVYEATFAGNTTMLHLLMGAPVESIAQAPFAPAVTQGLALRASDLWLKINPAARAYLMPHVASYVGADITADLLAAGIDRKRRLTLLVDFGTNAEIVLGNRERILACSAAAGPCFEGGNISCGMRASRGAICAADIVEGELVLHTVDGGPAAGICGTGLLDIVALLVQYGLIEDTGRMLGSDEIPDEAPLSLSKRMQTGEKGNRFLLSDSERSSTGAPLYVTQRDIRELQAAKGAIAAGIVVLCQQWGTDPSAIREFMMAGAFGNSIRKASAVAIGLLPNVPHAGYRSIGNAAGVGAQMALLSESLRRRAENIAHRVGYTELSSTAAFTEAYMDAMMLQPS